MNLKPIRKTLSLLTFLFFTVQVAFAGDLGRLMPKDSWVVVSFNGQNFKSALDIDALLQLEFMKDLEPNITRGIRRTFEFNEELFPTAFFDPAEYGFSYLPRCHFFYASNDSMNYFSWVFPMKEKVGFESTLTRLVEPEAFQGIQNGVGFQYTVIDEMVLAWTSEELIVFAADMDYSYYDEHYGEDDNDDEYDYRSYREKRNKVSTAAGIDWVRHNLSYPAQTLSGDKRFEKALKNKHDVGLWVQYPKLASSTAGMYWGPAYDIAMKSMKNFVGSSLFVGLNFRKGQIDLDYYSYMPEEFMERFKGLYKARANKNYLTHLHKDHMLGYISLAMDPEVLLDGTGETFMPLLTELGKNERDMPPFPETWDLIRLAIDEDALFNLVKGDALFAVTGVKEFEMTYTTYKYDEDYNATEVEKTRTETLPAMLLMFSTGDEASMQKVLNILVKMELVTEKGDYYVANETEDLGMEIFIGMHNGVVMLTNDESNITENLLKGVAKENQLSKEHAKRLKKNAIAMWWDLPQTFDAIPKSEYFLNNERDVQAFEFTKRSWEGASCTGVGEKKTGYSMKFTAHYPDGEDVNSFWHLANFINDMFLIFER